MGYKSDEHSFDVIISVFIEIREFRYHVTVFRDHTEQITDSEYLYSQPISEDTITKLAHDTTQSILKQIKRKTSK
jgi:hypothetical protein